VEHLTEHTRGLQDSRAANFAEKVEGDGCAPEIRQLNPALADTLTAGAFIRRTPKWHLQRFDTGAAVGGGRLNDACRKAQACD
jgi:hypothetical protein